MITLSYYGVQFLDGERISTIHLALLTQYWVVTAGRAEKRTDGRTDGHRVTGFGRIECING